jgi:hypothetical protein
MQPSQLMRKVPHFTRALVGESVAANQRKLQHLLRRHQIGDREEDPEEFLDLATLPQPPEFALGFFWQGTALSAC